MPERGNSSILAIKFSSNISHFPNISKSLVFYLAAGRFLLLHNEDFELVPLVVVAVVVVGVVEAAEAVGVVVLVGEWLPTLLHIALDPVQIRHIVLVGVHDECFHARDRLKQIDRDVPNYRLRHAFVAVGLDVAFVVFGI